MNQLDDMKSKADTQFVVTLLNGTFASNATWTHPKSDFAYDLQEECKTNLDLRQFSWSGSNTIKGRLKAASELKEHLLKIDNEYRNRNIHCKHILVGHSHGGTVALYACKDEVIEKRVEGIACIFTPFVHFSSNEPLLSITLVGFLLPLLIVMLIYISANDFFGTGLGGLFVVPAILLIMDRKLPYLMAYVNKSAERLNLGEIRKEKLLIIRTVGDEAGGLIALGSIVGWVLQIFINLALIVGAIFGGYGGNFLLVVIISIISAILVINGIVPLWIVTGVIVFIIPILLLLRLVFGMGNGFDFPIKCLFMDAHIEPVPACGEYEVHLLPTIKQERPPNKSTSSNELKSLFRSSLSIRHSNQKESAVLIGIVSSWIDKYSP